MRPGPALLSLALALAPAATPAAGSADPACRTPKAFQDEVMRVVRKAFPDQAFQASDDPEVVVHGGSQAGLVNLRARVCGPGSPSAEERTEVIVRHFRTMLEAAAEPAVSEQGWPEVKGLLRLQLAPDRKLQGIALLARPFVPGVVVTVVIDRPDTYGYVRAEDPERWGRSADEVFAQAAANSEAAVASTPFLDDSGSRELLFFGTGDGYDAARLLSPGVRARVAERLGEPFYAGVAHRDFLVLWSASLPASSQAALRDRVRENHRTKGHAISPTPVRVWKDGRVEAAAAAEQAGVGAHGSMRDWLEQGRG